MKRILITGSSRGIGEAIARKAAKKGWQVIVHGRTDSDDLKKVHKAVKGEKVVFDLTDAAGIKKALKDVDAIDVLVNNAGVIITDRKWNGDEQVLRDCLDANLIGTWRVTKELAGKINKGGAIVNISSTYGTRHGAAAVLGYSMSKAGIDAMTIALAKELAPDIRVNGVAPSVVNTRMTEGAGPELIEYFRTQMLPDRLAEPEEIANAVLFAASDEASFMTGETIYVEGGYSIKGK